MKADADFTLLQRVTAVSLALLVHVALFLSLPSLPRPYVSPVAREVNIDLSVAKSLSEAEKSPSTSSASGAEKSRASGPSKTKPVVEPRYHSIPVKHRKVIKPERKVRKRSEHKRRHTEKHHRQERKAHHQKRHQKSDSRHHSNRHSVKKPSHQSGSRSASKPSRSHRTAPAKPAPVIRNATPLPGNSRPIYPRLARHRDYQGTVMVKVTVLASGRAADVSIVRSSGYDSLDQSALDAVKSWRFRPAMRGDAVMASTIEIPVVFRLTD